MRVFFSAGEASGDAYAAELLQAIQGRPLSYFRRKVAEFRHDLGPRATTEQILDAMASDESLDSLDLVEIAAAYEEDTGKRLPDDLLSGPDRQKNVLSFISETILNDSHHEDVFFQAVGGRRVRESGAQIVADSSDWGALGVLEALRVYPRVLRGFYRAKREIKKGRPGLFIPIDFGYMNVRLARHAKNHGWKVLYFIPPGSWRKDKQGGDLPQVTDAIVTPFPWSAEILNKMGASAHYFGHPLKEMVARVPQVTERKGIAVLPGSRRHEIESNIPAIAEAIKDAQGPVYIGVAPTASERVIRQVWRKWSDHEPILCERSAKAFKSARTAIVCSGTATLEAALCACPCVVVYRGTKAMEIEYKIRKPRFEYISLPNILLGRPLLKELIQWDASPENVRAEFLAIDQEGPRRQEILTAFAEIDSNLGEADCLERTAALAKSLTS